MTTAIRGPRVSTWYAGDELPLSCRLYSDIDSEAAAFYGSRMWLWIAKRRSAAAITNTRLNRNAIFCCFCRCSCKCKNSAKRCSYHQWSIVAHAVILCCVNQKEEHGSSYNTVQWTCNFDSALVSSSEAYTEGGQHRKQLRTVKRLDEVSVVRKKVSSGELPSAGELRICISHQHTHRIPNVGYATSSCERRKGSQIQHTP